MVKHLQNSWNFSEIKFVPSSEISLLWSPYSVKIILDAFIKLWALNLSVWSLQTCCGSLQYINNACYLMRKHQLPFSHGLPGLVSHVTSSCPLAMSPENQDVQDNFNDIFYISVEMESSIWIHLPIILCSLCPYGSHTTGLRNFDLGMLA